MGINEGFSAQSTDLGIQKMQFSATTIGAAFDVDSVQPGYINATGTGAAPAFGDKGWLVQVVNPQYPAFLSKMEVQYKPSNNAGDAAATFRLTLFVQRNTLTNAAAVATQGAIPVYGPPTVTPVGNAVVPAATPGLLPAVPNKFGIGTGPVAGGPAGSNTFPTAHAAAITPPLQVSVDITAFGGNPWQVVEGDVYYVQIETFSDAGITPAVLNTALTNVMVAVS
jgi:hypothetical protein